MPLKLLSSISILRTCTRLQRRPVRIKALQSLVTIRPFYTNLKQYQKHSSTLNTVYLMDENEDSSDGNITRAGKENLYTYRTYTCGELTEEHVGEHVELCGWIEFQRMNKFVVLRDGYGQTQLIIKDSDEKHQKLIEQLSYESIIKVSGTVISRPEKMVNFKQPTGHIEVDVEKLCLLNLAADKLPFNLRGFQRANESLRMQYRYLDLRFPDMQRNLRVRSQMLMKIREFLVNKCGFVDVETPTLFKATPGGAQEFIVPTKFPGKFYSLVQSPQQFKQMLMAGGIDRYFQIARCYRDETSRPDRQPEFTQLDIELSFTDEKHIRKLIEDLLQHSWPHFLKPLPKSFPTMTYDKAMELYGTDQPDTRIPITLKTCTNFFSELQNDGQKDFQASCLIFTEEFSGALTKSVRKEILSHAKKIPYTKLLMNKINDRGSFCQSMSHLLSEESALKLFDEIEMKENSLVFFTYGRKNHTLQLLGKIRNYYASVLENGGVKVRKDDHHILWIVDFPLFEENEETGKLQSAHHPFTAPNAEDLHLLTSSPLKVRSLSYDLILDGYEIGGGSIRNHNSTVQAQLLTMLGIEPVTLQHMLDMLAAGCPPHGGIALGLDRLLAAVLNAASIRDVIAFPKTFEGKDPLSGAPTEISKDDEKTYHIKSVKDGK